MSTPARHRGLPEARTGALLEVKDLQVEFHDRGAVTNRPVRGIELQVGRGEVLGIVGETGCGKSITAQAVLGVLPAQGCRTTGQIVFDGVDQLALPEAERARNRGDAVSIVFQNPGTAFNPLFTLGDQMRMVLRRHRNLRGAAARDLIAQRLHDVGLTDTDRVMRAYPHELSGGMLQRAMIAMALLCEPQLLILDEPTTALDVTVSRQILLLILELQRSLGFSVLLITHDLGVVRTTCDRVAVLYAGRVVETGPTDVVLAAPGHPYTRGLIGALPTATDERLSSIPGQVPGNLLAVQGCAFADRCFAVVEECRRTDPPLAPLSPSHETACLRSAEL
ncbi:ABC transporter ATP-binding protein [Nocardioides sp. GCM10027113]|uniref:ABC transporter ATP-binding protein n=1 Tax=unclassified Nocardioides TaxID=2615069 RepID=UPI00361976A3